MGVLPRNRGKAQYLRDRKPTPSLCFCDPGATRLRPGPGGHSAVKPSTSVGICASKAALCATGHARTSCDANAVHDRLLQSMRVRFSDSEQWSSLNKLHVCAQAFLFEMLGGPVSREASDSGDPLFKYPITGIAACCA